jgi:hypothetical protein
MDREFDLVARLAVEHCKLLEAVDGLERLVARPAPRSLDGLATGRRAFTRDMLLHFAHVQKLVLDPLLRDIRPHAVQKAIRSSDDLISVYEQFQRHAGRWKGLPSAENWTEYAGAIRLLTRRIRVRLAAQESEIYPLLPAQSGGGRARLTRTPIDYSAEAWKVSALIDDQNRPKAAA